MTATAAAPPAGLIIPETGAPVPLTRVEVDAAILGFAGRVTLRQHYRNTESTPVEAVYTFPLPESAALCAMVIETGGRRIQGQVREREEAFEIYDEALEAGHGAVLVDAERPNVFVAGVGNLLPDQELTVELTWVAELAWEGDALRFVLPTTVSPRYAPAGDRAGIGIPHGETVNPPVADSVPYGFSFQAAVEIPGGVAGISSPSHPLSVRLDGERAVVALGLEHSPMDRDLVLVVEPRTPHEPWLALERQEDGSVVAAASVVPGGRRELERGPREVVFVIDRSGSMMGSSIESVRRALQLCLRSLEPGDRFQLVGFGSTFRTLFQESRPYNDTTLKEASAAVDRMDADLGGTEILAPLQWVYARPPGELLREVVLLTDGQVSNEDQVIALARTHAARTRIFTFGVGHGCSEYLVRSLARVTGGAAEMITPGEGVEAKVMRQFGRIGRSALEGLRLAWEGLDVSRRVPADPGGAVAGEPLLCFAWLRQPDGKLFGEGVFRMSYRLSGEEHNWEHPVMAADAPPGALLGPLAARAAIRELEDAAPELYRQGGGRRGGRRQKRQHDEILDLATRYNLASSVTSFVAVETREDAADGPPAEVRPIPVALTHGWGGLDRAPRMPDSRYFEGRVRAFACYPMEPDAPFMLESRAIRRDRVTDLFEDSAAAIRPPHPSEPDLVDLVRLQRADGAWEVSADLGKALAVSQWEFEALADEFDGDPNGRDAVATVAALHRLEESFGDRRREWRLPADKAWRWLKQALAAWPTDTRNALTARVADLLRQA